MTSAPRPHRPVVRDPAALEALGESHDPVAALHAAHETAAVLVRTGRAADNPAVTDRLIDLVSEIGLSTLAELWAKRPALSLPGALWQLYSLREWMVARPEEAARDYAAGIRFTEPNHVVAGVDPTGPDEVRRAADAILRGMFTGDFAVALERAAAFCHVVSSGRADIADDHEDVRGAGRLQQIAGDLATCARMWRAGTLQ